MSGYENRTFNRVYPQGGIPARATLEDGEEIEGMCTDISITGLYLETKAVIPELTVCDVRLTASPTTEIQLRGTVVRSDENGVGLHFTGISAHSFQDLHDLLTEYADDADAISHQILDLDHLTPDLYE